MPYYNNGTLTTDIREVAISTTWDSQTDWAAYQSATNIDITNGVVSLAETTIPDQQDLHARYDATELTLNDGDAVTTFSDQTSNGYDLTAGIAPTYVSGGINGNPVVRFDGVDDYLDVAWSTLPQPNSIFMVFRVNTLPVDSNGYIFDAETADTQAHIIDDRSGVGVDIYRLFAGSAADSADNAADTQSHIGSSIFDGATSTFREDGTQVVSGDVGTSGMDGLTLGARGSQTNNINVDIGEVLVYPQDKSGIQADVENYLSNKWGIAI